MNEIVYLFELDSVNKGTFRDAFYALFREIVHNGNCVAVSMNQLCDSEFFARAVKDDFVYSQLLHLLEIGAIRVSRYIDGGSDKEFRTLSQYIQNAIEKCKTTEKEQFIFSNLPITNKDEILLSAISDALKYSDISKITDLPTDGRGAEHLQHIRRFVEMVIKLGISEITSIPANKNCKRTMEDFINIVISLPSEHPFCDKAVDTMVEKPIASLVEKSKDISDKNRRSAWYAAYQGDRKTYPVELTIIDCCYNYAVEDSIDGVHKNYNDLDFENSFLTDLKNKIQKMCNKQGADRDQPVKIHRWKMLCRFAEYRNKIPDKLIGVQNMAPGTQRMYWKVLSIGRAMVAFLWAIAYSALFFAVEGFMGHLEETYSISIKNEFVETIINILIFSGVGLIVSTGTNKCNGDEDVPDVFECMRDMVWRIVDCVYILFGGIYDKKRLP